MIQIDNVSFDYGSLPVLREVTHRFSKGDFVSIIGRNGSGKTTLVRCMAGFLRPQSGGIVIDGQQVHRLRPNKRVQLIGYVFQNPDHQLFRETVEEEVLFGLANIAVQRNEAQQRTIEILERLELASKRDSHPFRLARGDRQRLAIAAVTVLQPKVLMVDEPTTGQDPVRAREIMDILRDLNRQHGTTVIVVTHAMDLVAEYTPTVVAMAAGRIAMSGPTREVFGRAAQLEKPPIPLPAIVKLGITLGLDPPPLTVDEFVATQ
jgi:energy-coupling factor transporter ATP-binding protein EcfA2